jgi:hypothetical protein
MSDLTFDLTQIEAQLDELEKIALSADIGRYIGAGTGALLGGLGGYVTAARSPDLGPDVDNRTRKIYSTIKGTVLGGIGGLAVGQGATIAGRKQVQQFGQRQLHGLTGYLPGRGLLGRAAPNAKNPTPFYRIGEKANLTPRAEHAARLKGLKEMDFEVPEKGTLEELKARAYKELTGPEAGFINRHMPAPIQKARAFFSGHQAHSHRVLADENMTSIPGLVRAYAGKSPSKLKPHQVLGHNLMAQGVGMGMVLPAAMTIPDAVSYTQTGDEGQLGASIGSTIGYGMAGALPMGPLTLLGQGAGYGGRLIGRAVGDSGTNGRVVPNPGLQER